MRVITIQHCNVVKYLLNNGMFYINNLDNVPSNLKEPYKFMMKHYNYKHRPIFSCPVGYRVNFGGASTEQTYLIEMEIPNRFCKVQDYYGWSDFIYFKELPYEYEQFKQYKTVEQFGEYILDMFKGGIIVRSDLVYQVTTSFLRKSWVKKIKPITNEFIDLYVNNGGINILKSIL